MPPTLWLAWNMGRSGEPPIFVEMTAAKTVTAPNTFRVYDNQTDPFFFTNDCRASCRP